MAAGLLLSSFGFESVLSCQDLYVESLGFGWHSREVAGKGMGPAARSLGS